VANILIAEGTLLQVESATTPGTYITVGQRVTIDPAEEAADEVERTNLDSPCVQTRGSAIPDMGELGLHIQFDPEDADHTRLRELVRSASGDPVNWRLVWNNGTNTRPHEQFAGWVKSFKPDSLEKGKDVEADVTIRVTGIPTRGTTTIS
jgi:hypothetical protein